MLTTRCLGPACAAALLVAVAAPAVADAEDAKAGKAWVFLGTYTGPKSKGIYRCEMDLATGALSKAEVVAEVANPTFLAIHPSQKFLYAVNEIGNFEGKKAGSVSALSLDPVTGKLQLLNQKSSVGTGPRSF